MWNEITTQSGLEDFMNLFGFFHDSCIKEFKYISGAYVNENLSMYPTNDKRILRMLFQRKIRNPAVIEMEFVGLNRLNLYPVDEAFTCEISEATMVLNNGRIDWYDCDKLSENELIAYRGTVISSAKAAWRIADDLIGHKVIY